MIHIGNRWMGLFRFIQAIFNGVANAALTGTGPWPGHANHTLHGDVWPEIKF